MKGSRDYLVNGSEVHIDIYDDRMEIYSPGGMPDGSIIQDRDPLTVPSTRRNPVLADIFNRLGYMERKGSGFGKIIGGYEFQINYDESKKPSFRSDRYQFTVVMPNLNYNVLRMSSECPSEKESNPLEIQILNMIKKDNKISTEKWQ
ncbi:MAG: ATP-binding protein [Dorea sp.]